MLIIQKGSMVLITLLFLHTSSLCQDLEVNDSTFTYPNSIQFSIGGHGLIYTVTYERIIHNGPKGKFSGQIGFSYYPLHTGVIPIWIPVIFTEMISFNKHHIEVGAGHVFTYEPYQNFIAIQDTIYDLDSYTWEWYGFLAGRIGYRYQKPNSRFTFRVAMIAFVEWWPLFWEGHFEPYFIPHILAGASFGYNF